MQRCWCFALLSVSIAACCVTDVDCSLNGKCASGACRCRTGWTGTSCGHPDFLPLANPNTSGYPLPVGVSSVWGGSITEGEDKLWHMYTAQMVENCPLQSWKSNSIIAHATSKDPLGPYVYRDTVMTHFAHNPHIQKVPGTSPPVYALYHIGCGANGSVFDCNKQPLPNPVPNRKKALPCDDAHWVGVLTSNSPNGPWNNHSGPVILFPNGTVETGYTNPSMYFFPNGSAILAYRSGSNRWPGAGHEAVGLASCANWSGPCYDLTVAVPALAMSSNCRPPDATHANCEDMALWPDENGHWHMLTHEHHHFSLSLTGEWRTSNDTEGQPPPKVKDLWCGPYGGARPQIVLRGGRVVYLSTACGTGTKTRNFVRELRQ